MKNKLTFEQRVGPEPKKNKPKHPPVTAAGAWNRAKRATTTPEAAEHAQYRADYSAVRPKWDKTLAKGIADLKAKYRAKERAEKKKDKMK